MHSCRHACQTHMSNHEQVSSASYLSHKQTEADVQGLQEILASENEHQDKYKSNIHDFKKGARGSLYCI